MRKLYQKTQKLRLLLLINWHKSNSVAACKVKEKPTYVIQYLKHFRLECALSLVKPRLLGWVEIKWYPARHPGNFWPASKHCCRTSRLRAGKFGGKIGGSAYTNRVRDLSGKIFARGLTLYKPSVARSCTTDCRGKIFSRKDRANEAIKIFITWLQF